MNPHMQRILVKIVQILSARAVSYKKLGAAVDTFFASLLRRHPHDTRLRRKKDAAAREEWDDDIKRMLVTESVIQCEAALLEFEENRHLLEMASRCKQTFGDDPKIRLRDELSFLFAKIARELEGYGPFLCAEIGGPVGQAFEELVKQRLIEECRLTIAGR